MTRIRQAKLCRHQEGGAFKAVRYEAEPRNEAEVKENDWGCRSWTRQSSGAERDSLNSGESSYGRIKKRHGINRAFLNFLFLRLKLSQLASTGKWLQFLKQTIDGGLDDAFECSGNVVRYQLFDGFDEFVNQTCRSRFSWAG